MPTIPVYRQQVRQAPIADTRLGLRANADAFGAPIADGLQSLGQAATRVGGVMDRIAAEERQKADDQQIVQAAAKGTGLANDLQRDYEKHGLDDAVKASPDYEKKYATGMDEIAKGLSSEQQRASFAKWRASHEVSFQSAIRNRAYVEGEKSHDVSDGIAKEAAHRSIAINADPTNGDEGLAQIESRLEDLRTLNGITAKRKGLNAEQIAELNRQDTAQARAVTISRWNDDGYSLQAQELFNKHEAELDPKVRDHLANALELGTTKTIAQQKSAEIYSSDKSLEQMHDEADGIKDQRVQEAVKQRLNDKFTLHKRAVQDDLDALFESTYKEAMTSPLGMSGIPISRLQLLDSDKQLRLAEMTQRKVAGTQIAWETSKARRYAIESALADPGKATDIIRRGPSIFLGTMNEADQNAIASSIDKLKSGKGDEAAWLSSKEKIVNQGLADLGIRPDSYWTDKDKVVNNPRAVAYKAEIDQQATIIAKAKGRDTPNRDDVQAAVDAEAVNKVRYDEPGRNTTDFVLWQLTDDQRKTAFIPLERIPAGVVEAIRQRDPSKELSDADVERIKYLSGKGDDDGIQEVLDRAPRKQSSGEAFRQGLQAVAAPLGF